MPRLDICFYFPSKLEDQNVLICSWLSYIIKYWKSAITLLGALVTLYFSLTWRETEYLQYFSLWKDTVSPLLFKSFFLIFSFPHTVLNLFLFFRRFWASLFLLSLFLIKQSVWFYRTFKKEWTEFTFGKLLFSISTNEF